MPTITSTETNYYKVVGTMLVGTTTVRHFLEEVGDYQGAPVEVGASTAPRQTHDTPLANEQARGTIIRVVHTDTKVITISPTS